MGNFMGNFRAFFFFLWLGRKWVVLRISEETYLDESELGAEATKVKRGRSDGLERRVRRAELCFPVDFFGGVLWLRKTQVWV